MNQGNIPADPSLPVLFQRVAAGEEQGVKATQAARNGPGISPRLRGPLPDQAARTQFGPSQAFRSNFQSRCIGQISQCS